MRDIQTQLEKLRAQAAECDDVSNRAADHDKRVLFERLAAHFRVLAYELEKTIAAAPDSFLGRKTYEPFSKEEDT